MRKTLLAALAAATLLIAIAPTAQARMRLSDEHGIALAQNYLGGDWKTLTSRAQDAYPAESLLWCRGYIGPLFERGTRKKLVFQVAAICRTTQDTHVTAVGQVAVRLTRRYGPVFSLRAFSATR
jgi:hypothetical protein